jgi:predicted GNAT family acetyltransferase
LLSNPKTISMEFSHNQDKNRFELRTDGYMAHIEYSLKDDKTMDLIHTRVAQELAGKGIGKILVHKTLEHIKEAGYKFVPTCNFIAAYVDRTPEWKPYVAK